MNKKKTNLSRMGQRTKQIMVLLLLLFCANLIFSEPCGDVNSDGVIDIVDALLVAQFYVGLNPEGFDEAAADVSGDDIVDIVDALQIAQFYVGLLDVLPGCVEPTPDPVCEPVAYELQAEDETWDDAVVQSDHSGYTGTGYVNTDNSAGRWIEWSFHLAEVSGAECVIRYAHASGDRPMELTVNGILINTLDFPASGAWTTWSTTPKEEFNLDAGSNTIRLTTTDSNGAPNIDKMDLTILCATIVTPVPTPPPTPEPTPTLTPDGYTPPPYVETTIYYASDSTVRHYTPNSKEQQGVGQRLPEFLTDNISIANYAKGGCAINGFLKDGLWGKILDAIQPGDYVLIQFGINDRGDCPDKEVFKDYLRQYTNEARDKGAIPVFVTPTPRFQYDSNGVFTNAFTKYCEAKFEVGAEMGVTVLDLQTKGRDFFTEIGPSRVDSEMMMDTLHPLISGSYHLARLLAEAMLESDLIPLKNSVIQENLDPDRETTVDGWNPRDGYSYI